MCTNPISGYENFQKITAGNIWGFSCFIQLRGICTFGCKFLVLIITSMTLPLTHSTPKMYNTLLYISYFVISVWKRSIIIYRTYCVCILAYHILPVFSVNHSQPENLCTDGAYMKIGKHQLLQAVWFCYNLYSALRKVWCPWIDSWK